jgi:hypothetical protein
VLRSGSLRRLARRQGFRNELGMTVATIAVKGVQASLPSVVRASFIYSIGSVDNSCAPAIQKPVTGDLFRISNPMM